MQIDYSRLSWEFGGTDADVRLPVCVIRQPLTAS
jgi:hypothetical protein